MGPRIRSPNAPPDAAIASEAPAPGETPRAAPTAWHLIFGLLLAEKGSPDFTVESEVPLLAAPPRADFLLLRRKRRGGRTRPGRTLRHLWAWIEDVALVELKTTGRPLRAGDVERWLGLALAFQGLRRARGVPGDVQPVLVVPRTTPTLRRGLAALGLTLRAERAGYWAVVGGHSALRAKVLVLDAIADAERDELLGLFAGRTLDGRASRRWLSEHGREVLSTMGKRDPEYANLIEALVEFVPPERLLRGVSPKRRLEGLTPEQRLAGLAPEQLARAVAGLPLAARQTLMDALAKASSARRSRPRTAPTRAAAAKARAARSAR